MSVVRRVSIITGSIISFLLIVLLIVFAMRDSLLRSALDKVISKAEREYGIEVGYSGIETRGLRTIAITDLDCKAKGGKVSVYVGETEAKLAVRSLFSGDIRLRYLGIDSVNVHIVVNSDTTAKDSITETTKKDNNSGLSERLKSKAGMILGILPDEFVVRNITVSAEIDSFNATFGTPKIIYEDGVLSTEATYIESAQNEAGFHTFKFYITCSFDRDEERMSVLMHKAFMYDEYTRIQVPYLGYKYGAKIEADSLNLKLGINENDGKINIDCSVEADSLTIDYDRLSDRILSFGSPSGDIKASIDRTSIEIDTASVIKIENLEFSPYIRFEKDTSTKFTLKIDKDRFAADDLFSSIPSGLMPTLEGIKVAGDIDYHLNFGMDTGQIDSLEFSSSMKKYPGFKIVKFGAKNYAEANDSFTYHAYSKGQFMRDIEVGTSNPMFVTFDNIPKKAMHAVLYSEDPSFFRHRGFLESALRESMVKNIKEKRFARGGSTISMQLVKNLFLSRNKTLLRKAEEALIVWLIENNNVITKERMMEIYLNVIEWGPNIYGIGEASRFYFDCEPKELNPSQCIYLASIVPRPTKFMYTFDGSGKVRDWYAPYYAKIAGRMEQDSIISENEAQKVAIENVKLTGPAKDMLKITVPQNSEEDDED